MDLDALRKAALSSKKRKLTPQPQTRPPTTKLESNHGGQREKEEGEIEDESVEVAVNPIVSSRTCTSIIPSCSFSKRDLSSIEFLNLHLVLVAKEEAKEIIAQLLSYGIPADYLLSIGISREILLVA